MKYKHLLAFNHNTHIMLLLSCLYLAQGLPVGFMTQALPTLLRYYGLSLTEIGGFGLLMLPWAIKFMWAPAIDRFALFGQGHYRSWLIPLQLLMACCLIAIGLLEPTQLVKRDATFWLFVILIFSLNTIAATQDVATDGLAVASLQPEQRVLANSIQVAGSRLGFILGGGLLLWGLLDWSWFNVFFSLSVLILINTLALILYVEPVVKSNADILPKSTVNPVTTESRSKHSIAKIKRFIQYHWGYFIRNAELRCWFMVLLFYKISDGLSGPVLKPMMIDMQFNLAQMGLYVTVLGAISALVGAAVAIYFINSWRASTVLVFTAATQMLVMAFYSFFAWQFEKNIAINHWAIYLNNMAEEFFSAIALVALFNIIMHYARAEHAASDFSFQVGIMAMVSGGCYILGGFLSDQFGYFYFLCFLLLMTALRTSSLIYWLRLAQSFAASK